MQEETITHLIAENYNIGYIQNDGKGNLTIDTNAFPMNGMNIAIALAHDFDGDGDIDLFVGSRSTPQQYGITPISYLYENNGKREVYRYCCY